MCLLACNFHKIAEEQLLFSLFGCHRMVAYRNNNKNSTRNECEFVLLRKRCMTIRLVIGAASQKEGSGL